MKQVAAEKTAVNTTYISIAGNTVLAIIKLVTGFFGNSFALIADGIESTTDIFASIILLLGLKYSIKPPDKDHPYGHGRAEPLITFIIVGFLIVSAVFIAYQSIENINTPHELPESYTLYILGCIIILKEIFYRIVVKRSKEIKSMALKADAWHHRSDAITSVAAFIGIMIALLLGRGYESADDWAALLASVIILYNGYLIFRPALGEIMDEQLYDDLVSKIREISAGVEGVAGTEKCYIRKTGLKFYIDLHITVNAEITVRQGHHIAHKLKDKLIMEMPEVADVLIHTEPSE